MKKPIEIRAKYIFYIIIVLVLAFYVFTGYHGITGMISGDASQLEQLAFASFFMISGVIFVYYFLKVLRWLGKQFNKYFKIV